MKNLFIILICLLVVMVENIDYKKNFTYVNLSNVGFHIMKKYQNEILQNDIIIQYGNNKKYYIQLDYTK